MDFRFQPAAQGPFWPRLGAWCSRIWNVWLPDMVSESCPQLDRSSSLTLPQSLQLCRDRGDIAVTQVLYASLPPRQTSTSSPHRRFSGYGHISRCFHAKISQTTDSQRAGYQSQVRGWHATFCGNRRAKCRQSAFLLRRRRATNVTVRAPGAVSGWLQALSGGQGAYRALEANHGQQRTNTNIPH